MHFFGPVETSTTIALFSSYLAKVYIGIARFIGEPRELFHSLAWVSSIKACSGEYSRIKDNQEVQKKTANMN